MSDEAAWLETTGRLLCWYGIENERAVLALKHWVPDHTMAHKRHAVRNDGGEGGKQTNHRHSGRSATQSHVEIRNPDILRALGASLFNAVSPVVYEFAALTLTCWVPDRRTALLRLSGMTVERGANKLTIVIPDSVARERQRVIRNPDISVSEANAD
ncbi:hypothetical protein [Labrenzia sp. VG12]|uniref:hypothetical protein n=1 Tax=Labrenzia sp. VG12 TaxID=2021862 RepID=UPI000B8C1EEF|nr:hypothetical protein [Labrenzia sp. VG12]ASP33960.1 hypothetical protein CHH27_12500 [Labrenzia sp. VG12]